MQTTTMMMTGLLDGRPVSPRVQQLAAALLAGKPNSSARALAARLLHQENLDPQVRHALLYHGDPLIRVSAWRREDVPLDQVMAQLRVETSPAVMESLLSRVNDITALVEVVRYRTENGRKCSALYEALAKAGRFDLPNDLLLAVMAHVGMSAGREVVLALADSGRDLSVLASATEQVSAFHRLAACASTGTPDTVLNEHLPAILATKSLVQSTSEKDLLDNLLRLLSDRVPNAAALFRHYQGEAAKTAGPVLPPSGDTNLTGGDAGMVATTALRKALREAVTADRVRQVWDEAGQWQEAIALSVVMHQLCPLSVFTQARKYLRDSDIAAQSAHVPLWCVQDKDLFMAMVRREASSSSTSLASAKHTDGPSQEVLVNWALDALLTQAPAKVSPQYWADLLTRREFPRERFADLPAQVVITLLNGDYAYGVTWVSAEALRLVEELTADLPDCDPGSVVTMLESTLNSNAPFTAALAALRTSMGSPQSPPAASAQG